MSLILDALNRSRQDARQVSEQAPGLDSPHYREPSGETGIRSLVLLAVALCLALGVIAWLLLDRPTADPPPPVAALDAAPPTVADAGAAAATRPAPGLPAERRPADGDATDRMIIPENAPTTPAVPPAVASPTETGVPVAAAPPVPEPKVAVEEDDEVAALYRQRTPSVSGAEQPAPAGRQVTSRPSQREERPIDIEAMVARAQTEMANRGLQDNPVPLLVSLSQQFKDSVPSLMYLRHDYSGIPGKSTVVINGKTVAAGGSLPGGIKVEEILPDSVILSFQGTRFRLRALNSWVNL